MFNKQLVLIFGLFVSVIILIGSYLTKCKIKKKKDFPVVLVECDDEHGEFFDRIKW